MTGLLAGCAMNVPLPERALLEQLQAPRCEYRMSHSRKADSPAADTSEELRSKLDYEAQCYRHAEMIARARLKSLQKSVSRTVVALRAEQAAQERAPQHRANP
jgi:hypothetical protein